MPVRDSATAVEALRAAGSSSPAIGQLELFLAAVELGNVDDMSRVASAMASPSRTASLIGEQNDDGGFGLSHEYGSDVLDTALALRALAIGGDRPAASRTLAWLIKRQSAEGAWGDGTARASLTGEALLALVAYRAAFGSSAAVDTALARATMWLAGAAQSDGSWASSVSAPRATALALGALASSNQQISAVHAGAAALIATQSVDGSWGGAYETALAVRALASARTAIESDLNAQVADPSVYARDISVSPQSVETGRTTTVNAVVSNEGLADSTDVVVEFFLADPVSGADPAGTQTIPSIAAGQQVAVEALVTADVPPGRHRLYVVVRSPSGQDRDVSNNSAFVNLYVRVARKTYDFVRDWPRPGRDVQRSGTTPNRLHAAVDGNALWRVPANGGQIVAQGKVYYGDAGLVKAVDAKTGALRWQANGAYTDGRYRPPVYNRGFVYTTYPGVAVALSAHTGSLYYGISGWGGSYPSWATDVIPRRAGYDAVLMYDPTNQPLTGVCDIDPILDPTAGNLGVDFNWSVWTGRDSQGGDVFLNHACNAPYGLASDDNKLFTTTGAGYLAGIDLATATDPNGNDFTPWFDVKIPDVAAVPGLPLVDSLGQVVVAGWEGTGQANGSYTVTGRGRIAALDPNTGAQYWSFATDAPLDGSPVEYKGTVFAIDRSGRLYGLDQITGALKWNWQATGYEVPPVEQMPLSGQTLALSRHYLYVPHPDGRIHTLDARTGDELSSTAFSGRPYDLAIDDTNNAIYVRTLDGFVGAYPTLELPDQCEPDPANEAEGPRNVTRASVYTDGTEIPGRQYGGAPSLSADGQFVAFAMSIDYGSTVRGYVRDLQSGVTTEVPYSEQIGQSYTRTGVFNPALSGDGRFLAFASNTTNSQTGQKMLLLYVRDLQSGVTEPLLVTPSGEPEYARVSQSPPAISLSYDGSIAAFSAEGNGIVPADTDNVADVFVIDRSSGARTIVSVTSTGEHSGVVSTGPTISADGRFVAFTAEGNLTGGSVEPGTNRVAYRFDRALAHLTPVSLNSSGQQVDGISPSLSSGGRYVAFSSFADSLVPPPIMPSGFNRHPTDSYLYDSDSGETEIVSVNSAGERSVTTQTGGPVTSGNGRYAAFSSFTVLAKGDASDQQDDIVVRDRDAHSIGLVSHNPYGVATAGNSTKPAITPDGAEIAFVSDAGDLVDDDFDGTTDVFVWNRGGWPGTESAPGGGSPSGAGGCPPVAGEETEPYSDLAVGADDILAGDLEQGLPGHVSVAIHNDGAAPSDATTVRLYDGTSRSGTLIAEQALGAVAAGGQAQLEFNWDPVASAGTHSLTVVVDADRQVFEQNVANNEASKEVAVSQPRVDLSVATDNPSYGANQPVEVAATVTNQSGTQRTGSLVVTLEDSEGDELDRLTETVVAVPANDSLTVPVAWNTLDTSAGSYVVRVQLKSVFGDVVAEAATPLTILPDVSTGLTLATDAAEYGPGESLTIEALARNLSANSSLQGASLTLTLAPEDETPVDQWTLPIGEIAQGASSLLTQLRDLDDLTPGTYRVTGALSDAGGSQLAQASTQFAVESSATTGAGLRGSLTAQPTDPYKFSSVSIAYSVSNAGNADVSDAVARVRVSDLTTGQTVKTIDAPVVVPVGSTSAGSASTTADMPENRDYQVSLHLVLADGSERPLDREIIHVRPVPFTYGASLSASPTKRVLVWACDPHDEAVARAALGETFATYVPDRNSDRYSGTLGCALFNHDEEVEFLRLMRSGAYNQFWLLGAHHPFELGAGDELAARVIQGDGLLVAGSDPSLDLFYWCSNRSPLGATFAGILPWGTHTIKFAQGSPLVGLDASVTGSPTKVTTTTATAIGTTTYSTWFGTKTAITATYNQFAQGRAIYIGASPRSFGDQARAAQVLAAAGSTVASTNDTARGSGPVRLDLFTEGIAPGSPLTLRTALPIGSSVLQAPAQSSVTTGELTVPFDSAVIDRQDKTAWLRLPPQAGLTSLTTTAYYTDSADGQTKPYGTPAPSQIQVAEDRESAKSAAAAAVNAVTGVGFFDWWLYLKIKDDVAGSISPTTSSSVIWWRIKALTDDLGILERVSWGGRDSARLAIARLITYVQYDYYTATGES